MFDKLINTNGRANASPLNLEIAMPETSFTTFTLGKYRAVALLGKGGFGTVFRAIDTTLDRQVALKVLHPQLVSEPNFVERFRNEAKTIAALRHPNVVGVYELGEDNGRWFITMEYMPGGTLKDRLAQQGRLSFAETLHILQQVCAGLEAAHAEGLIHRDIKPGNILFDKRGIAVVGDFGLARVAQLSSMASSSSSSAGGVGTPFYKAPELWRGKPPASPATDVYALACVAYEMLSGHVLFDGDTPDVVITKHVVDGPDFGADWLPADAPAGLSEVLQHALAMKPAERYATAQAFADALNEQEATSKRQEAEAQEAAQRAAEVVALETKRQQEEQEARRKQQEIEAQEAARYAAEVAALEAKRQQEEQARRKKQEAEGQEARRTRSVQEAEAAMLAAQRQREAEDKANREAVTTAALADAGASPAGDALNKPVSKTPWGLIIGGMVVIGVLIVIVLLASSRRPAPVATPLVVEVTRAADQPAPDLPTSAPASTAAPAQVPTMIPITPVAKTSDKDGMTLLYVPAGEFTMGAASSDTQAALDETPQHTVYLDAYWIDQTEVTNAMYAKCVAAGKCEMSRVDSRTHSNYYSNAAFDNYPAINVSWADATTYCQWAGHRLPTEAEWEKAARGNDGRIYPWGNETPDASRLNFNNNIGDTTEVGKYSSGASPYGALDMAGNVWEWVQDFYSDNYYSSSPARNPENTTIGSLRLARGGSWYREASDVRVSKRGSLDPSYFVDNVGFRCAMSAQP